MPFVEVFQLVKYADLLVSIISRHVLYFLQKFSFFFHRSLEKVNGSAPLDDVFKGLSISSTPILTKSVDADYSKFCLVR